MDRLTANFLCGHYIALFYPIMSSKPTQTKKTKKTSSDTTTRKARPLSPAAATFDALNNPSYDTTEKHFSPPQPPPMRGLQHMGIGITGPAPIRRTQSLGDFMMPDQLPDIDAPLQRPLPVRPKSTIPTENLDSLGEFESVPGPDEPLKGGRGYMYPALKNYLKRAKRKSKKNSKKKSKRKSKKKSKKNSKKNSKKKSKKARRRL